MLNKIKYMDVFGDCAVFAYPVTTMAVIFIKSELLSKKKKSNRIEWIMRIDCVWGRAKNTFTNWLPVAIKAYGRQTVHVILFYSQQCKSILIGPS